VEKPECPARKSGDGRAFSLEEAPCGSTRLLHLNKLLDHHPNCFESLFIFLEWGPTLQVSLDNPRFKGNEPKFVFYLYSRVGFERFATGSGVPTLNRNDVHSHRVLMPATIAEQTAIAAVLSDMDAELAALEARRDKTRALKQAMMQALLTGRIRLIDPSFFKQSEGGADASTATDS